jgi:hypothetical protein
VHRVDTYASLAATKQTEIVLDTVLAGRPDAFNPAALFLTAIAARGDGVDGPYAAFVCQARSCRGIERKEPSTMKTTAKTIPVTIGLDIAKNFFQVHAVDAAGQVVLRRKLSRGEVLRFFEAQPRVLVGIEACGTGHFWAREIAALGHEVGTRDRRARA